MKKIITLLALVSGTALLQAQGTIAVNNIGAGFLFRTNASTSHFVAGNGATENNTQRAAPGNVANSYYFALLIAPTNTTGILTQSSVTNLSGSSFAQFSLGMMATNKTVAGGISGSGGSAGAPVAPWAAPTDASYASSGVNYYFLMGWSSNLGNTYAQILAQAQTGLFIGNGFFGVSSLAFGNAGGGPNGLPAPNVFGTGVNPGGLTTGFDLFAVTPIPEPTTFALAGLGAASLLIFRKRKQ